MDPSAPTFSLSHRATEHVRGDGQGEEGESQRDEGFDPDLPPRHAQEKGREDECQGRTRRLCRGMHAAEEIGQSQHAESGDERKKSAEEEEQGTEQINHGPCGRGGRG